MFIAKTFFQFFHNSSPALLPKFSSEVPSKDAQLYINYNMIKREQMAVRKQLYEDVIKVFCMT